MIALSVRLPRLIRQDDISTGRVCGLGLRVCTGALPVDQVTLSLAVFLGGLVSGFSGFAFSAPPARSCCTSCNRSRRSR
jgi:hypothetical protein